MNTNKAVEKKNDNDNFGCFLGGMGVIAIVIGIVMIVYGFVVGGLFVAISGVVLIFVAPVRDKDAEQQKEREKATIVREQAMMNFKKYFPRFSSFPVENGKMGVVGTTGKMLLACQYDDIVPLAENPDEMFFAVENDGKWGVVGSEGKVLLPCEYDCIENVKYNNQTVKEFLKFKKSGKYGMAGVNKNGIHSLLLDCLFDDVRAVDVKKNKNSDIKGNHTMEFEMKVLGAWCRLGLNNTILDKDNVRRFKFDVQVKKNPKSLSALIPDSATAVEYVFSGSKNTTSVNIPNSVTEIAHYTFEDCEKLTAINVAESNEHYCSIDGVLFNKNKTTLIQYPKGKIDRSYIIPDSVKNIGEWAFFESNNLISVTIGDGVAEIGDGAFADCKKLTSITIPDNVEDIGYGAFAGCENLISVIISGNPSVEFCVFVGCEKVVFPKNPPSLDKNSQKKRAEQKKKRAEQKKQKTEEERKQRWEQWLTEVRKENREKETIKRQILEKEKKKRETLRKKQLEAQVKAKMIEQGIISNDDDNLREPIPQDVQDRVWNRDGGKCVKCGSQEKLEFDHIIPFSKGGSNTYRNLQVLCEKCNRSKSNNIG